MSWQARDTVKDSLRDQQLDTGVQTGQRQDPIKRLDGLQVIEQDIGIDSYVGDHTGLMTG
jgi:hypothetical protein